MAVTYCKQLCHQARLQLDGCRPGRRLLTSDVYAKKTQLATIARSSSVCTFLSYFSMRYCSIAPLSVCAHAALLPYTPSNKEEVGECCHEQRESDMTTRDTLIERATG